MASQPGVQPTRSIQSLDRGLAILEAVARSTGPVSLGELTILLGIDRSSVFRLANTLKRRGFLTCPSGRKDYILGPSIWRLSRQYDWSNMLIQVSHEPLKQLAAETNETAHLAVREGKQALFIDHVASSRMIAVAGQVGELVPLYCTAHGKALLADFDRQQLTAIFGTAPLRAYTAQTITSIGDLAEACAQIKEQGYATDDGEFMEGIRCVAAPIHTHDGPIIGAIGISTPGARFSGDFYRSAGTLVSGIASRIGAVLSASIQA
jgi:IclR family transcriptional regulator, acetate operon repressor